jgi:hypothetical protein
MLLRELEVAITIIQDWFCQNYNAAKLPALLHVKT